MAHTGVAMVSMETPLNCARAENQLRDGRAIQTLESQIATPIQKLGVARDLRNIFASTHKNQNRVFWFKMFGMTSRIG